MIARLLQFVASSAIGCATYAFLPDDTPRMILSVFMGVGGLMLLVKIWVYVRHGKEAAASVSLVP